MIALAGLLPEQLRALVEQASGQPEPLRLEPFRALQLFKWIAQGVTSFDQMSNVPLAVRTILKEAATLRSVKIAQTLRDSDGTLKLQIELSDHICIETVLLQDFVGRKTLCMSSQAGCALACRFCRTGELGFARNLSASEIVEQFLIAESDTTVDNIVFMGMGEPLLNLAEVTQALAVLTHPKGRNFAARRVTISTSGIIDGIYALADADTKTRLAVSLTSADPELRQRLMPVAVTNPLPLLKQALLYYTQKTGKRITLEAALLGGVNTDIDSAVQLADFARDLHAFVNLIPWNPVPSLAFRPPVAAETAAFVRVLEDRGVAVGVRTRRGEAISGACGQLAVLNTNA
jgi:23S rRNA (adenine2503-C2)-methyltransferase